MVEEFEHSSKLSDIISVHRATSYASDGTTKKRKLQAEVMPSIEPHRKFPLVIDDDNDNEATDHYRLPAYFAKDAIFTSEKGSFEKDQPDRIIYALKEGNELFFTMEWHKRLDGMIPEPTEYTNKELREKCPQILLDFYQANIRFLSKSPQS